MLPEEYRLIPTGAGTLVKRVLLQSLAILIISAVIFFARSYYTNGVGYNRTTLLIWGLILVYSISSGLYRALKKHKNNNDTFLVTIDDNTITGRLNDMEINFSYLEVREITKMADGSIVVRGGINNDAIIIPVNVENKYQLEDRLDAIMPITTIAASKNRLAKLRVPIFILFLIAFIAFLVSANKWITLSSALLILAIMVWSFIRAQKSMLIDTRRRRQSWLAFLPMAVIVIRIIQLFRYWHFR